MYQPNNLKVCSTKALHEFTSHTFKHVILNVYLKLENYVMKHFVNFMNANVCTCIIFMNLCILFILHM